MIELRLRLHRFAKRLGHLVDEGCTILASSPGFCQEGGDRPGGPSNLIRQCVLLLFRKLLGPLEDPSGVPVRHPVYLEVSKTFNLRHRSICKIDRKSRVRKTHPAVNP